ncbi:hypothetical protein [Nocardioides flavescens]|uniref:Uncharacterized protein n=1 Tax=Nocardioides flavescens TaxID=2691959 RepID=A0A6L7EXR4_9ACTN|nr:hypothetical protein [Nocardioides flavescens]MXG89125.1 hypothetical protein [Nocardioides flavescens]
MEHNNRRWGTAAVRALSTVGLGGAFAALSLVFVLAAATEMATAPEVLDAPRVAGVAVAAVVVVTGLAVLLVGSLRRPVETPPTAYVETQDEPAAAPLEAAIALEEDLPTFIIGLEPPYAAAG